VRWLPAPLALAAADVPLELRPRGGRRGGRGERRAGADACAARLHLHASRGVAGLGIRAGE
jgi:hypothetical protein